MDTLSPTYTARIRSRGQVTIPQPVRESLSLDEGEIVIVIQVGNAILLTPHQPQTPELAKDFSKIMEEEGVSLADLLEGLAEERAAIHRERQMNAS